MAYFTTVDTSIVVTTFVELVSRHSFLGPVSGVVILVETTFPPIHIFIKRRKLRRPLKVCFSILRLSPQPLAAGGIFMATASKVAVTAGIILPKIRRLRSLKTRLRYRTFPFILVCIRTTSSGCN